MSKPAQLRPSAEPSAREKLQAMRTKSKPSQQAIDDLNQCAHKLLQQLPDHASELVQKLAEQNKLPIWQYACGMWLTLHQEGRLSDLTLDPAWKDGLRKENLICNYCKESFKPRHMGQLYCTNDCGLKAAGMWHGLNPDFIKQENQNDVDLSTTNTSNSADSGWAVVADPQSEAA